MAEDLDPFTAEQLLRGEPVDGPLGELLAAAAEPAYEDELAGEELAAAAFVKAGTRRPARSHRLQVAIAVLAVAGTGAAAAAATGTLPMLRGSRDGASIQSAPSGQASAGTGSHPTASTRAPSSQSQSTPPGKPSTSATRQPSKQPTTQTPRRTPPSKRPPNTAALVGLCQAYTVAGPRNDRGMENPAFTVLITIAGGKERVRGYCERLLDQMRAHPDFRSGRPTAHPSNRPTIPPAGDRATAPTPRAW